MNLLRSLAAIAAGFFATRFFNGIVLYGLGSVMPDLVTGGSIGSLLFEGLVGLLTVILGGYLTATLAKRYEIQHGMILGALLSVLTFFFLTSAQYQETQAKLQLPLWFVFTICVLTFPAAIYGAVLRSKQSAILLQAKAEAAERDQNSPAEERKA